MDWLEDALPNGKPHTASRIDDYIATWKERGYEDGIPDEVPDGLMRELIAPSYKAICFALLKNDLRLRTLGFPTPTSGWYSAFKQIELADRKRDGLRQLFLPLGS